jgi:hypothetical protein
MENQEKLFIASEIFRTRDLLDRQIIILQQIKRINEISDKSTEEYKINKEILLLYNKIISE